MMEIFLLYQTSWLCLSQIWTNLGKPKLSGVQTIGWKVFVWRDATENAAWKLNFYEYPALNPEVKSEAELGLKVS